VEGQAVHLDGDLLVAEKDVDLPASGALVGLPAGDARLPQQRYQDSFRFGMRAALGGPQQSARCG
jgi:hypothetical protein